MSHSKELISRIAGLLAVDYPEAAGYRYTFEQRLRAKELGRAVLMPDIQIDQGGTVVCVVEIGYTRPEKLTAYRRKLRIPDVRWYDKDGTLHADVQERVVSVSAEPAGDLYAYPVFGAVDCPVCQEEAWPRIVPEHCSKRYIRRFGRKAYAARQEEALEALEAAGDVSTHLLTDYVAVWLLSYCDECDRSWLADEVDGFYLIEMCRDEPRSIAKCLGVPRAPTTWAEARKLAEDYGLSLNYLEGHFLDKAHRREIQVRARQA